MVGQRRRGICWIREEEDVFAGLEKKEIYILDQRRRRCICWIREEREVSTGLEKKKRYMLDQRRRGICWIREGEVSTGLEKKKSYMLDQRRRRGIYWIRGEEEVYAGLEKVPVYIILKVSTHAEID